MTEYDQGFFDLVTDGAIRSAKSLVPVVNNIVHPKSVLDVGSGNGAWLKIWQKAGVKDMIGVDGDYVDTDKLLMPVSKFKAHDLTTPLNLGRKFDLVMSLEVAEHLNEEFAEVFVKSLTRHSDVIFFSAALPGQSGVHHVNERWLSYWSQHFASLGYKYFDILRPIIWDLKNVEPWYRQNSMIFATDAAAKRLGITDNGAPLDIVHPELFTYHLAKLTTVPATEEPVVEMHARSSTVPRIKEALKGSPVGPMLCRVNQVIRNTKRSFYTAIE